MKVRLVGGVILVIGIVAVVGYRLAHTPGEPRFRASPTPAYVPVAGESFAAYVQESRRRLREALATYYFTRETWPFGPPYTLEQVVDMRAPYEITPSDPDCPETDRRGFLLIHGLSDSPYLLRHVATGLAQAFPCARLRGLLTPGHGTVPGDLQSTRREGWYAAMSWAVAGLLEETDQFYLVGYSNGGALALAWYGQHQADPRLAGIIMLSPGLEVRDPLIPLASVLQLARPWVSVNEDRDAVKYESFPMRAAAEFHQLTREVTAEGFPSVTVPVMMVMSGHDTTINSATSLDFFCDKLVSRRRGIWYASALSVSDPHRQCESLRILRPDGRDPRYISHSHVAITIPPTDRHYGRDGNYANCQNYTIGSELRSRCETDHESTVYGEYNLADESGLYQGQLVRRATFNPDFDAMLAAVVCFIEDRCE